MVLAREVPHSYIHAVIITIFYITGTLDFYPKEVSSVLSITGLLIILRQQMLDAREFADHRPNTIHRWIMSFPTEKPITVYLKSGLLEAIGLKARGSVSISEEETIEKKVDFLIRQVSNIQSAIANIDDRVTDLSSSLTKREKELKVDLDNLNASLKTIIAGHIVGDYDQNLLGVIITICGTLIQFFRT